MKRLVFLVIIVMLGNLTAVDLLIEKTDGSIEAIALEDIINITFSESSGENPGRVLFIGNSYTYTNGGIDAGLAGFVSAAHPEVEFIAEAVTQGGATFEMHYNNAATLETISEGEWDYVILQEQSTRPVENPELMYEYGALLDSVIVESGAETALFMTWARAYDPGMIDSLAYAYNSLGEQLNAMVCPVGRAWENSLAENSELELHVGDGSHPNVWGSYLAICVIYACLFGESPQGVDYVIDPQIREEDRDFLQRIAWETVLEYNPWDD